MPLRRFDLVEFRVCVVVLTVTIKSQGSRKQRAPYALLSGAAANF